MFRHEGNRGEMSLDDFLKDNKRQQSNMQFLKRLIGDN